MTGTKSRLSIPRRLTVLFSLQSCIFLLWICLAFSYFLVIQRSTKLVSQKPRSNLTFRFLLKKTKSRSLEKRKQISDLRIFADRVMLHFGSKEGGIILLSFSTFICFTSKEISAAIISYNPVFSVHRSSNLSVNVLLNALSKAVVKILISCACMLLSGSLLPQLPRSREILRGAMQQYCVVIYFSLMFHTFQPSLAIIHVFIRIPALCKKE